MVENGNGKVSDGSARALASSVLVGVVTALALACGSNGEAPTESPGVPQGATQLQVERPSWSSQLGRIQERTRSVIRDRATWESFWSRFGGVRIPPPELPQIDFEERMVIVAAMGQRSASGFEIAVETVYEQNGTLHVSVLETSPAAGCLSAQNVTTPVTAVVVPLRDAPVEFVEREQSRPC